MIDFSDSPKMYTNTFIDRLNAMLNGTINHNEIFHQNGYIRMNMVYLFPYALIKLKNEFESIGLRKMFFTDKSLEFEFYETNDPIIIAFDGNFKITSSNDKIFALDFDFAEPRYSTRKAFNYSREIEIFMMKSDVFFFMIYKFDFDAEVLNNPLHESVDLLTLEFRRRQRSLGK